MSCQEEILPLSQSAIGHKMKISVQAPYENEAAIGILKFIFTSKNLLYLNFLFIKKIFIKGVAPERAERLQSSHWRALVGRFVELFEIFDRTLAPCLNALGYLISFTDFYKYVVSKKVVFGFSRSYKSPKLSLESSSLLNSAKMFSLQRILKYSRMLKIGQYIDILFTQLQQFRNQNFTFSYPNSQGRS